MNFYKYMVSCIHHYNAIQKNLTTIFKKSLDVNYLTLTNSHQAPSEHRSFTIFVVWPFSECHITGIIHYVAFKQASFTWQYAFKFPPSSSIIKYILLYRCPIVCLSTMHWGQIGCFRIWAIVNEAAMNVYVQGFVWT